MKLFHYIKMFRQLVNFVNELHELITSQIIRFVHNSSAAIHIQRAFMGDSRLKMEEEEEEAGRE